MPEFNWGSRIHSGEVVIMIMTQVELRNESHVHEKNAAGGQGFLTVRHGRLATFAMTFAMTRRYQFLSFLFVPFSLCFRSIFFFLLPLFRILSLLLFPLFYMIIFANDGSHTLYDYFVYICYVQINKTFQKFLNISKILI